MSPRRAIARAFTRQSFLRSDRSRARSSSVPRAARAARPLGASPYPRNLQPFIHARRARSPAPQRAFLARAHRSTPSRASFPRHRSTSRAPFPCGFSVARMLAAMGVGRRARAAWCSARATLSCATHARSSASRSGIHPGSLRRKTPAPARVEFLEAKNNVLNAH